MSYSNLSVGRYSSSGQVYLVTTVTAQRWPIFHDFNMARCVIGEMRRLNNSGCVSSMAWVLMPDHLHWLFQLGASDTLSRVMQNFKGRSSRAVKLLAEKQAAGQVALLGGVWQRAYHDRALRQEDDVRAVARYLAANPLRAGLVTSLSDYAHWDAVWV